jgi:hypothetical protein
MMALRAGLSRSDSRGTRAEALAPSTSALRAVSKEVAGARRMYMCTDSYPHTHAHRWHGCFTQQDLCHSKSCCAPKSTVAAFGHDCAKKLHTFRSGEESVCARGKHHNVLDDLKRHGEKSNNRQQDHEAHRRQSRRGMQARKHNPSTHTYRQTHTHKHTHRHTHARTHTRTHTHTHTHTRAH